MISNVASVRAVLRIATIVAILRYKAHTSWAKKKFVIACVTVLLKGVLGVLSSTVFNWIMEVLMKLPNGKFGVMGEWAVLWGPSVTPFLRRRYA